MDVVRKKKKMHDDPPAAAPYLTLSTRQSKEDEEDNRSREDNRYHSIPKMDVDTQSFVKGQILVQLAARESSNCVSAHRKGNECHLEENGMH